MSAYFSYFQVGHMGMDQKSKPILTIFGGIIHQLTSFTDWIGLSKKNGNHRFSQQNQSIDSIRRGNTQSILSAFLTVKARVIPVISTNRRKPHL